MRLKGQGSADVTVSSLGSSENMVGRKWGAIGATCGREPVNTNGAGAGRSALHSSHVIKRASFAAAVGARNAASGTELLHKA